ncbi:hypothetical protein [Mammaliicoccus sciuri]|uniref:hypothetical protein n=1 Tax=Mammaliicoccus sciuri TaxID=1296 RepID=UPI00194DE51F|nr:hypothetical protein [Mammaliicoccus sciuri]MCJ0969788.1 hypothetical protein [Mammaliicoccus sciuri]
MTEKEFNDAFDKAFSDSVDFATSTENISKIKRIVDKENPSFSKNEKELMIQHYVLQATFTDLMKNSLRSVFVRES